MDFLGQPFYLIGGGGGGGGTGNVTGPNSSTIDAIPRFATNTGKVIKNSPVTVSDTGRVQGVSVIQTDFVESSTNNPLTLQSPTDVKLISPTSLVEVNTDVILDTGGTVSLTGRATPIAIAIDGDTSLTGTLSLTSTLQMNGASQIKGVALPSMPQDAATKEYVDNNNVVKWAQLLYNSVLNDEFSTSNPLDTVVYQPLLFLNDPPPPNYFISSSGVNVVDNVGFLLLTAGTYRIKYRIGIRSNGPPLETQTLSLVLRIDNINRPDTEQFISITGSVTYHDFEFIYTNPIPPVEIRLYAKVSAAPISVLTSYLCFNVIKI